MRNEGDLGDPKIYRMRVTRVSIRLQGDRVWKAAVTSC